jgi:hypothetical protein
MLAEGAEFVAPAVREDVGLDRFHRALPGRRVRRPGAGAHELDAALERDPGHHLAADEMQAVAELPDVLAGLAPLRGGIVGEAAEHGPVFRLPRAALLEIDQRAVGEIAVAVDLMLGKRVVAEEHRARDADVGPWERAMDAIRDDVLAHGWSDALGAFRQHYGADTLDASTLLIPVMKFPPIDDPRLRATVARIEEQLTRDGLVFRFDPEALPTPLGHPLGAAEGAFLPCTFWIASALAMGGEPDRAEAILVRVEATAGDLGLLAEEMDPATGAFLGNTPLLFSHAEYLKAILAIAMARPTGRAALMAGHVVTRARRWLRGGPITPGSRRSV